MNPKNSRKRKWTGVRTPVNVVNSKRGGLALEVSRVRVTLLEDEGPQPPLLVQEEHPSPHLRLVRLAIKGLPPPPLALMAPTRAARTPSTYDFSSFFPPKFKVMLFQNGDIKLHTVVLLFLCFLKGLTQLCCL